MMIKEDTTLANNETRNHLTTELTTAKPTLTEGGVLGLIFRANENSFNTCFKRVGPRLISLNTFTNWIKLKKEKERNMNKNFCYKLSICMISFCIGNTYINAAEEAYEPLQPTSGAARPRTTPPTCMERCVDSFPAWYHPCWGPIVTNIKYLDLDPYWVNNRSANFQEVYREVEPLCPSIGSGGRMIREARKLCILSRAHDEREDRYDPLSNWCSNFGWLACLTMMPAGLWICASNPILGEALIEAGGGSGLVGSCNVVWCALAKIHYDPPRPGLLGYIRSPMPNAMA